MKTKPNQLKRFEKKLSFLNHKEFKQMFMEFKKIVENDNTNFSEFSKLDINYEKFKELARAYLLKVFEYNVKSTIRTYTKLFGWELSKTKIAGIKDIMLDNYNKKYAAKKAKQLTDTTREILSLTIKESQNEGLGLKGIVKAITTKIEYMGISRAKTIARTETSSAINNTSMKTASESGMDEKGWVHIGGRYTSRANHKRLNGKWIPINEKWDLGNGLKAICPHDPELPAGEVINCNCLQIYRKRRG